MRRWHAQPVSPAGVGVVKAHDMEYQRCRLIPRVLSAVTEKNPCLVETRRTRSDQRGNRIGRRLPARACARSTGTCCHALPTAENPADV